MFTFRFLDSRHFPLKSLPSHCILHFQPPFSMSDAPVPSVRESAKAFTELYKRRKEAEETRKAAKRSTDSLASWNSAQY